jgi:hypothetical protein
MVTIGGKSVICQTCGGGKASERFVRHKQGEATRGAGAGWLLSLIYRPGGGIKSAGIDLKCRTVW